MSGKQKSPPFIVVFYDPSVKRTDFEGRTIDDILGFSDSQLERYHDFIQVLFPLPESSPFNHWAPVITKDVRDAFHSRQDLREAMRTALNRMLNFYGFKDIVSHYGDDGIGFTIDLLDEKEFYQKARRTWLMSFSHNHLRITRILRCLRVLGDENAARAFLAALRASDSQGRVGSRTHMYWDRALDRAIHLPPDEEDEDAEGTAWLKEPIDSGPSRAEGEV